jgi:hypothetical protein
MVYGKNRRGSPCGCPYFLGDRKGRPYGVDEVRARHAMPLIAQINGATIEAINVAR